jgi:hypothetical protein
MLAYYLEQGFMWVRRHDRDFDSVLRTPTVGIYLELFMHPHLECVHIHSAAGKKMLRRLCYY